MRTLLRWVARLLLAIVVDALAWGAVQATAGYGVHRLPDRLLAGDGWLLRERRWERCGRFYEDTLQIRRWKGLLPEAGAAFAGGFDKRQLQGRSPETLDRHMRETRRAELGHWVAIVPTPVFVRRNPWLLAPFMPLYAAAVNLPCIAAQRYNRIRLRRARDRAAARLVRRPA